jgi:hypothetical protein
MKKLLNIVSIIVLLSLSSFASSRSDVQIIEATEKIRYWGQKISKEYLYLYYNPKKIALKEGLLNDIEMLERSIKNIAMSTKSIDSKNILDFLTYNKNEIRELLDQQVDREKSILMLDYSESFLEGANSIASLHKYEFSDEEKMLMLMKEFEYLLERVSKYYIASHLNLDTFNNLELMTRAISKVELIVADINSYNYPHNLENIRIKMNEAWKTHKDFLYKSKKLFLPNLLQASTKNIEVIIEKMALYHKKNQ